MSVKTIGLVSPGDMGHVVGKVLQSHGLRGLTRLEGRSERTRMLAQEARIDAVPTYEDLVAETEMVLSIIVPEVALATARLMAKALRHTGRTTTFVDCNAVSPETWQRKPLKAAIVTARWHRSSKGSPPICRRAQLLARFPEAGLGSNWRMPISTAHFSPAFAMAMSEALPREAQPGNSHALGGDVSDIASVWQDGKAVTPVEAMGAPWGRSSVRHFTSVNIP